MDGNAHTNVDDFTKGERDGRKRSSPQQLSDLIDRRQCHRCLDYAQGIRDSRVSDAKAVDSKRAEAILVHRGVHVAVLKIAIW